MSPLRTSADRALRRCKVQLLSNGSYHLMVTQQGLGFSHCKGWAVTRWGEEAAEGGLGSFCYLRDVSSRTFWSTTAQPVHCGQDAVESTFSAGRATFLRRHVEGALDIATQTDVAIAPDHGVELRRVRITTMPARRGRSVSVYALPPHTGRGGWTWYTGSAGWLYRLIEAAIHMVDDRCHHIVEVRVDAAREAPSPYAEA